MTPFAWPLRQPFVSRALALLCLALSAVLTAPAAHAATLVVDLDGFATATNCSSGAAAFNSIQTAVNAAAPGDTIFVCPGQYNEQVVVSKNNLTILGSGVGSTVLRPSSVVFNSTALTTPGLVPVAPVLLVRDVVGVTVTRLSIDGSGAPGAGAGPSSCGFIPHFYGLFYRNASGTVDTVHVTNIRSATVCAIGTRIESGGGGSASVVFRANLVDHYGAAGVVCAGLTTACTITGSTVRGLGAVNDQFQVGISVRTGAVARIAGNVITDHFHLLGNGRSFGSTGILLVYTDPATNPHLLRDNIFANNELNVARFSTAEVFD